MNFNEIMQLTQWLEKSAFTSYSLSVGGISIEMGKHQMQWAQHSAVSQPVFVPQVVEQSVEMPTAFTAPSTPAVAASAPKTEAEGHIVRSPIVGTYYESSNPEKPAFVKVGQAVKKGDVLCILEAMKIMNEICADVDGIVAEIFMENGQMCEARAPLFRIEV